LQLHHSSAYFFTSTQAALTLYGDLLPLVRQHLALTPSSPSQPPPRIAFTVRTERSRSLS
jgi:hypothetical protein